MRTSIATVCISGTLEEKLEACAAAGFDGVELFEQDLVTSPLAPEEVRARAARLGLSLDLYQPFRDLEGVSEEQFQVNLARLEAKLKLMDRLGIDTILVCSNVATASVHDDAVIAGQLRRAGELAARYGKRIAYEALAWGTHVSTYWHSWELVRAADHPAVGLCVDSFHILSRGDDPSRIEEIPGERIFFVQLADAEHLGMDVLLWSRHHRVYPGEGDFDLRTFLVHLLRAGYRGPLSLEIFNDVFREAAPSITAVDGARSLVWLQQRTRGALAVDDPQRRLLAEVPKIDPVERVDHIEVVTDEPDDVGAVLTAIGFELVGRHVRKDALLFRAGDAQVVLTPSQSGGTRVGSVAVAVTDAEAAVRRAVALGAVRAARPVTGEEADLPGVVASVGWHLFFVDPDLADWPREFGDDDPSAAASVADAAAAPAADGDAASAANAAAAPTADAEPAVATGAPAPAGLVLDHLNMTEARFRFEATTLFLESVLRMESVVPFNVPSHRGLVRSKVLESPGKGVRWVFNLVPSTLDGTGGDGDGGRSGDGGGSGAHRPLGYPAHAAFAVDDAERAAEQALARGLVPLPIPRNYYDDLGARCGIDADTLARWQRVGLLYDQDATGGFLHFYTRTVGRVFFEIVQRIDGYTGYGPADAPVRLSAQAEPG